MKDKLLAALKLKFPGASDATLTRIATKKAGSVTEESQIEAVVEAITFDMVIQSETDARIADANKKAVDNFREKFGLDENGKPIQQQQQQQQQSQSDDVPAWAKPLLSTVSELRTKLTEAEQKSKQASLTSKLLAKAKEKGIPEKLLAGRVINDESEIEPVFTEVETTYNEIRQSIVNGEVDGNTTPVNPAIPGKVNSAKIKTAIERFRKDQGLPVNSETKK